MPYVLKVDAAFSELVCSGLFQQTDIQELHSEVRERRNIAESIRFIVSFGKKVMIVKHVHFMTRIALATDRPAVSMLDKNTDTT